MNRRIWNASVRNIASKDGVHVPFYPGCGEDGRTGSSGRRRKSCGEGECVSEDSKYDCPHCGKYFGNADGSAFDITVQDSKAFND
jgi:hypothetical protein